MKKIKILLIKQVALRLLRFYWKLFKPCSVGVRVIIKNEKGEILLVLHSYKPDWYLPGGNLKRLERSTDGVKREAKEETNLDLKNIRFHGIYRGIEDDKNDWMLIFIAQPENISELKIDEVEIIESRWINPKDLSGISVNKRSMRAINEMDKQCPMYHLDI